MELNKIYCEDCLETMRGMEDKSVDLVLTDPPYGLGFNYDGYDDSQEKLHNLIQSVFPEMKRVSKRIVLTPGITNINHYPTPNWVMAWVYEGGSNMGKWGFNCWQPILCYGGEPYLEIGRGMRPDIIKDNIPAEKNGHPCPKPLSFWRRLLKRVSAKDSDVVYDPFMGSGTTALACLELNKRYIGSEISPKYCEIAERRIKDYCSQQKIFD